MIRLYYRLNSGYELRGWELLPFALCDSRNSNVSFMRKNLFLLLYHCDGLHDISTEQHGFHTRIHISFDGVGWHDPSCAEK